MRKTIKTIFVTGATLMIAGASLAGVWPAQAADGFYAGKQVRLFVGSSAGGGYDIYTRTIGAHISKYLPGKPSVVIQNSPGAASRKLCTWLYTLAPRDGTVFAGVFSSIPTDQLFNPKLIKFDARKFTWLGSANRGTMVGVVWHKAKVTTLEGLKHGQMIVGSSGGGTYDFPVLTRAILGLKFKVITGYKGTKEISLAWERGEVDGNAGLTWASAKAQHAKWLKDGELIPFVQYGRTVHPELKKVPLMLDLAKTEADRQALNLAFSRLDFARPYVAPPGLPEARVRELRHAFEATLVDKAFLADAKKRKLDVSLVTGKEMEALMADLYATPAPVITRVQKILTVEKKSKGK